MNTFIVDNSFKYTAKILDNKSLNKQIQECKIIIRVIFVQVLIRKSSLFNHPVFSLWRENNEESGKFCLFQLLRYTDVLSKEFSKRGYSISDWVKRRKRFYKLFFLFKEDFVNMQLRLIWTNDFYDIMKINLLRKDLKYYKKYFNPYKDKINIMPFSKGYIWENPKVL